jgi:hypothetical protein
MLGDGSSIDQAALLRALLRGYAVASAGSSRQGEGRRAPPRIDLAARAVHAAAEQSRALIAAYYGHTPRYAYWINAASADGAQALVEVQTNPADFDGVVVGGAAEAQTAPADLAAFAARAGKVIEFLGGANQAAAENGVNAYERLAARSGGVAQTRGFYRLFLMPLEQHGDSYRADWITVLDEWVQRDRAPEEVLANHLPPPNANLRTPGGLVFEPQFGVHTVCAYPEVARLQNGSGETAVDYMCLPGPQGASANSAAARAGGAHDH